MTLPDGATALPPRRAAMLVVCLCTIGAIVGSISVAVHTSPAGASESTPLADLIFVTDDCPAPMPGCDDITVVDATTGKAVDHGDQHVSPGKLAATSDGSLILSVSNNQNHFVAGLGRSDKNPAQWWSSWYRMGVRQGGAIAITPDDSHILVGMLDGSVTKFVVDEVSRNSIGPVAGRYGGQPWLAAISYAPDSRTAFLVGGEGELHFVDVETMTAAEPSIQFRPVTGNRAQRVRMTYADVSPDGRFMVINTGGPRLTVVDLQTRTQQLVDSPGLRKTYGVEFNHVGVNRGPLAVHGHSAVAVYNPYGIVCLTPCGSHGQ